MASEPAAPATVKATAQARFVTGSTMRHVVEMTLTSAVGLMAMFLVDLADLYFISLLNDTRITAAIGYAGTIGFANLSISIGLGIASAALVARNLGARQHQTARRFATSSFVWTLLTSVTLTAAIAALAMPMLRVLGASGMSLDQAWLYLITLTPGFPMLAGAIACSFCLRAIGDPRRAMLVTLTAAACNAVLDPIFIFGFGLGIQGAAIATVCADLASLAVGLYGLQSRHGFLMKPCLRHMLEDVRPITRIAFPAVLTQLATPFTVAWMTRVSASFGPETVAAVTIVNRLIPVAFGVVFSLSGAVGPIIGQNHGAALYDRVRQSLSDALKFCAVYTLAMAGLLFVLRHQIPDWFHAQGETVTLVTFFCTYLAITWAFTGAQFVSHAAFNNLGKAHWSTWFNWGKATVGTVPLLYLGGAVGGAKGMFVGFSTGSVVFGILATVVAYRLVLSIERQSA